MKKTILTLATLLGATLLSNAQTLVDSWTAGGEAWDQSIQTDFDRTIGGTIYSDATSDTNATLVVTDMAPASNNLYGGLYNDFFYSFFSQPSLSINTNTVLDNVQFIQLKVWFGFESIADAPVLNFNESHTSIAATSFNSTAYGELQDSPAYMLTYTWDVSSLGTSDGFSIDFDLGLHNPIGEIVLTQSVVPEPSTYALLFGAAALGFCFYRRKKS